MQWKAAPLSFVDKRQNRRMDSLEWTLGLVSLDVSQTFKLFQYFLRYVGLFRIRGHARSPAVKRVADCQLTIPNLASLHSAQSLPRITSETLGTRVTKPFVRGRHLSFSADRQIQETLRGIIHFQVAPQSLEQLGMHWQAYGQFPSASAGPNGYISP